MAQELFKQCTLASQVWGGWSISTLYQQGLRHAEAGQPCDDAYVVAALGDHLLLAVADGVSTQSQGRVGAQLAVAGLVAHVDRAMQLGPLHADVLAHAMANARGVILSESMRRGIPLLHYSTTLAAVLIDATTVRAANIGDSSITQLTCVLSSPTPDQPKVVPLCSAPQRPDERVYPLTFDTWQDHLQLATHPADRIEAIVLATDGAGDFIEDETGTGGLTSDLVVALRDAIPQLKPRMLPTWLAAFLERGEAVNYDDRTLLVAVRTDPRP